MVQWGQLFNGANRTRHNLQDEVANLLPTRRSEHATSAIPAEEVTKVALRLKYQIEAVIPCELEEELIIKPHSTIVTPKVIETAKQAGGEQYASCVVFALLECKKWFKRQSRLELWDAELHLARATACEIIAKRIIEAEEDYQYLLEHVLLKRFSIVVDGIEESAPANAIERAVDLHALQVIGSSGYQKCVQHLWRGWLVQDDTDTSRFVPYKEKLNTNYWVHFDPDRMRVPQYQNALQVFFSIAYLAFYTGAINTINKEGDLDFVEGLLYIFTLGFLCDEIAKIYKVGKYYIGFWNVFNSTLYALMTVSFITRLIALTHTKGDHERERLNILSYNFLAFSAPMFWLRLLLYFDTFRFFGAMLVVVKVMMKESLIFFALLVFVVIGFFQAFIGMDANADKTIDATSFILQAMANAVMQSPEFDGWNSFAPPFGLTLYYIFTFVIMVVLLNILIALYNSAYEDITGNALDEYMALYSAKCLQFVRAPDENVFIAPLNLIELLFLVLPFEWWMARDTYESLNDWVMGILYSPLLLLTAFFETRTAHTVRLNRKRGEDDEDTVEEWEQLEWKATEDEPWIEKVKNTTPDVSIDGTLAEVRALKKEIEELKELIKGLAAGKA